MTKYGWKDNSVKVKTVTADSIVSAGLTLNATTVGTAASGTAAYIPVTVNGAVYYVEGKQ